MQIRDTLVGWWKFPIAKKVRVLYEGYIRVNERGSWQGDTNPKATMIDHRFADRCASQTRSTLRARTVLRDIQAHASHSLQPQHEIHRPAEDTVPAALTGVMSGSGLSSATTTARLGGSGPGVWPEHSVWECCSLRSPSQPSTLQLSSLSTSSMPSSSSCPPALPHLALFHASHVMCPCLSVLHHIFFLAHVAATHTGLRLAPDLSLGTLTFDGRSSSGGIQRGRG
eukprot:982171-Rhodomonas_salina.2